MRKSFYKKKIEKIGFAELIVNRNILNKAGAIILSLVLQERLMEQIPSNLIL